SMDVLYEPRLIPASTIALSVSSAFGKFTGKNYRFDPREDPLSRFVALANGRAGWRARGHKFARQLQHRTRALLDNRAVTLMLAGSDRRLGVEAAGMLAEAARHAGYLSSDVVFADRLEALSHALETVRKIVGSNRSAPYSQTEVASNALLM